MTNSLKGNIFNALEKIITHEDNQSAVFRRVASLSLFCLGTLILLVPSNLLRASSPIYSQLDGWSVPQVIPGFDKGTWPPYLVADQNRQVHAFSSQWINKDDGGSFSAIIYNRWTLKDGWTQPRDIILSPSGEARITNAYLDSGGVVHILFWAGDNTAANIYYSRTNLATVDQISSWPSPVLVAEDVGDPPSAILTEDRTGDLILIYHGRQFGAGVYVIKSQDGGRTWSAPVSIFQTDTTAPLAWNVQASRGNDGWLHVIWNVLTLGGQGRGIYYSRTRNSEDWKKPVLLDSADEGYGTQTPAIIEYNGELLAFFAGIGMRRSTDNGETWSNAGKIFFRHVGVNGSLSPVIDGSGALHLFFGQRITGSPDIHGMWHSVFINNRWIEPEAIIRGPAIRDMVGENSFDPYEARAVVSQGNVMLVTWRTDPGLRGNGVWYSYKVLGIPESSVIPSVVENSPEALETPVTVDVMNTAESVMTLSPSENSSQLFSKNQSTVYNFGYLIFLGVLPVIILIVILLISRIRYTNRP